MRLPTVTAITATAGFGFSLSFISASAFMTIIRPARARGMLPCGSMGRKSFVVGVSSLARPSKGDGVDDDEDDKIIDIMASASSFPSPPSSSAQTDFGGSFASPDDAPIPLVATGYAASGLAAIAAWTAVSAWVLLFSRHPDPPFADCSVWHNALTASQALLFPIPILGSVAWTLHHGAQRGWNQLERQSYRRLNLAWIGVSAWLAAAARYPARFAFGYDPLNGLPFLFKGVSLVHMASAGVAWGVWKASVRSDELFDLPLRSVKGIVLGLWTMAPSAAREGSNEDDEDGEEVRTRASLYATASLLFGWFAVQSVISPYPLATVPSILGKRLSRPAAAFYLLAAVVSRVLKDAVERGQSGRGDDGDGEKNQLEVLRKGLLVGSFGHVVLVLLKLLGIDGGGYWIPGRGLWELYPAMMAVPFATGVSLLAHVLAILAAWKGSEEVQ